MHRKKILSKYPKQIYYIDIIFQAKKQMFKFINDKLLSVIACDIFVKILS